jgi:hypothetical protein
MRDQKKVFTWIALAVGVAAIVAGCAGPISFSAKVETAD